jgi:hypothetical protein
MPGFCPDEGEAFFATMVINNTTTDRGTGLELGLFTGTPTESTTYSTLSKVTSNLSPLTYTLADGTWTGSADSRSYVERTFTASATIAGVTGYYIATTGTTKRLIAVEIDPNGPYTLNVNDTYKITPTITIA